MRKRCCETRSAGYEIPQVRRREVWNSFLMEQGLVDFRNWVKDICLVVYGVERAIGGIAEQELREEGELASIPSIAVEQNHEEHDASKISGQRVRECVQRVPHRRAEGCNVLPIEADGDCD